MQRLLRPRMECPPLHPGALETKNTGIVFFSLLF
jgi:hypothetical protein